jgi:hypothetical protein
MTNLLKRAFEEVSKLPPEDQDRVAAEEALQAHLFECAHVVGVRQRPLRIVVSSIERVVTGPPAAGDAVRSSS